GVSYHGVALNVSMDLEPFSRINPCGYEGLQVTQLSNLIELIDAESVSIRLSRRMRDALLAKAK
ncbi:MAG: octanoyltransferase, partial [Gammaproteobacteria bacterium]